MEISSQGRHHPAIKDAIDPEQKGGISGKPTVTACNDLIFQTYREYRDDFVIVGAGGIFDADEAYEKIKLGATTLQLITGMIFMGPQLIGQINRGLVKRLKADGYSHLSEAVGAHHRSAPGIAVSDEDEYSLDIEPVGEHVCVPS